MPVPDSEAIPNPRLEQIRRATRGMRVCAPCIVESVGASTVFLERSRPYWNTVHVMPRDPTFSQIHRAVCVSVHDLYDSDSEILGTTERVVVGRLILYLNGHLAGLIENGIVLDQDYERAGRITKRLAGTGLPDRKMVPDLILHRRRDQGPSGNLLAIEVKTVKNNYGRLHDFAKLSVLTGHADNALAYGNCLRLPGDPEPTRQTLRGHVSLPCDMHPYKYGLWLLVAPTGPQFWWWLDRRGPKLLTCDTSQ